MLSQQLPSNPSNAADPLLVACLCAAWCGTCTDYRAVFERLKAEFADAQFMWVDIEDRADLVDPIEVDDFPTVLIATRGQPVFFGPITPHPETLRRLVQTHSQGHAQPLVNAEDVAGLVARLTAPQN